MRPSIGGVVARSSTSAPSAPAPPRLGISGSTPGSQEPETEITSTSAPEGSSTTRADHTSRLPTSATTEATDRRGPEVARVTRPSSRERTSVSRSAPRLAPVRSSGGERSTARPAETRTISAATASARRPSVATGGAAAASTRTAASARTPQG